MFETFATSAIEKMFSNDLHTFQIRHQVAPKFEFSNFVLTKILFITSALWYRKSAATFFFLESEGKCISLTQTNFSFLIACGRNFSFYWAQQLRRQPLSPSATYVAPMRKGSKLQPAANCLSIFILVTCIFLFMYIGVCLKFGLDPLLSHKWMFQHNKQHHA